MFVDKSTTSYNTQAPTGEEPIPSEAPINDDVDHDHDPYLNDVDPIIQIWIQSNCRIQLHGLVPEQTR